MGLRFLSIEFELRSPAIITRRRTERGFLSAMDHILASTLRGALLSAMYRDGVVDKEFLNEEASNPRFVSSPAYPIGKEDRSYPCHPFAYECKIPHKGETPDKDVRFYENYVSEDEVLKRMEEGGEPRYKVRCPEGHLAVKYLHPHPVIPNGKSLKKVRISASRSVSVGVSKRRASSRRGLLYEYEAISAGQKFWANLAIPNELSVDEGMEFLIGRGVSRGFGLARVVRASEIDVEELVEKASSAIKGRSIVLYALSKLLGVENGGYRPCPTVVDLGTIAKRCGFESDGKLRIERVYGRVGMLMGGWDMLRNEERPLFGSAGNQGSIVLSEVEGSKNVERAIAMLGLLGTIEYADDMPIVGVNMLFPLRGHPMEGRG